MTLKFYFDLMSQPARAIFMFLKVNKIPFQECPIAIRKGEHKSEEFTKINPFQKIPVIDHDGFVLTESVAILKYLATVYKVDNHWYPQDVKRRAKVDEYMAWQHANIRMNGSMYFLYFLMGRKPVQPERVEKLKGKLDATLNQMEETFLATTPYISSQEISIADLLAVCELEQPLVAGYDFPSQRPVIKAYMERVKMAIGPAYDDAHKIARKVANAMAQSKL